MKTFIQLAVVFSLMHNISFAQQGNKQKVSDNAYEAALKTVINQLMTVMAGKDDITKLTGSKPPLNTNGLVYYNEPALVFAGGLKHTLYQTGESWKDGNRKTSYNWEAKLLEFPKSTPFQKLLNELKLLSKAAAKIYPAAIQTSSEKKGNAWVNLKMPDMSFTFFAFESAAEQSGSLTMNLYFDLSTRQTREERIESMQQILIKEMAALNSVNEKMALMKKWYRELEDMNTDQEARLKQGSMVLKKLAATDIRSAYAMLMEWPRAEDLKQMSATLSYTQQESIRKMAREQIDQAYHKTPKEPEPVVKNTPAPSKKEETDPCKLEVAALTFRPGHWIYGQNRSALVFNYNCGLHLYTIAWMNSKGRLEFESNVTKESLASRYRLAEGYQANKFILCRDCAGKGYGYGYDRASSYIGSLRIEYNTGELVRQSCGYCSGKGCIKVN
jgi:hypothetical protein